MINGAAEEHWNRGVREAIRVKAPEPVIGSKSWCSTSGGLYVLEEGPGALRCIACTHPGSASATVWDGTPAEPEKSRLLFRMVPTVLGHFMLDFGFNNGLFIEINSRGQSPPFLVIGWIKAR